MIKKVAVIGGGAAGYFFAINLAMNNPDVRITIFEKTSKILSKVKVSGGGRCNVTNSVSAPSPLSENYPRGKAFLKKLFKNFTSEDTVKWFGENGVILKTENDGRIFPVSDSSQSIIDCFTGLAENLAINVKINTPVYSLKFDSAAFLINDNEVFDFVFIATGGSPKSDGYKVLQDQNHCILRPLPSLFTFNIPSNPLSELEGVSVKEVRIRVEKTNLIANGAFLVTHWGLSGPAVLRLSAWGAETLASLNYNFRAFVNFVPSINPEKVRDELILFKEQHKNKNIVSNRLFDLSGRLWERLCEKSEISKELRWNELSKQNLNKLTENLTNFSFEVNGKTTFKEEFVTCGGVSLEEVNNDTMESKIIPNLYFGGEVLNIDGITGGFNFQAAWTTAWVAAKAVSAKINQP